MGHLTTSSLVTIAVVFFSSAVFSANDAALTSNKAQATVFEPKKDFVMGIFKPMRKSYHSKVALMEDLNVLVQDEKNIDNLTEAYRQIEQTNLLSTDEKIQWIEKNQGKLPAPFLILLTNYLMPNNINEAAKWYVVGSLRMELDARKCMDKDATRSGNELILERLTNNLQESLKGNDEQDKIDNFTKSIKNQFENAVNFHITNPYQIEHPFWLSSHAISSSKNKMPTVDVIIKDSTITVLPTQEQSTFKPEKDWKTIEESVIYQLRKELS